MSRLKMKHGTSMRLIGDSLFKMSAAVYRDPALAFSSTNAEEFEEDFKELFEGDIRIEKADGREGIGDGEPTMQKGTVLRFHYDRTYTVDGETLHVVNILVPDLYGKALKERVSQVSAGTGDPQQFDLDDYAAECLGMVTILSCGS